MDSTRGILDAHPTELLAGDGTDVEDLPPAVEIGPYVLEERLGEGGMGVVYAGRQDTPVRRRVAVKLIRPGLDSREVLARFDRERQALSLMEHAGIATFLDAGTTPRGYPYFVMELVDGEPITDYCDHRRLTLRQRVELFLEVCGAVQHAHQKGVLHRDLKPSNVLVVERDGVPVPKVIDFGIAKALAVTTLPEGTRATRFGGLVGTPAYMSPEQLRGSADIDTRSDVYSLGVLLYRLLVGALPYELDGESVSPERLWERIESATPPRASTRASSLDPAGLAEVSQQRDVDAAALPRLLRGELDWILGKTLEPERDRRYATPAELAADLRSYLEGRPVAAGPPSRAYRLRKLAWRHRLAVAAGAAVLTSLVGGLVASLLALRAADRARRVAEEQTAVAEAVTRFLEGDVIGAGKPHRPGDRELTLREVLDRAARSVEQGFDGPPVVEAAIHRSLAEAYYGLGMFETAVSHKQAAFTLLREHLGLEHPDTLFAMMELAVVLRTSERLDEAAQLVAEGLPVARRVLGDDHKTTLAFQRIDGGLAQDRGELERAEAIFTDLLDRWRRVAPDDPLRIARAAGDLAIVQQRLGLPDQVETSRAIYEAHHRAYGDDHEQTALSMLNLGVAIANAGREEEAEPILRTAVDLYRRILGPDHQSTGRAVSALGGLLRRLGRLDEARPLVEEAYAMLVRSRGEEALETLVVRTNLARLLRDRGDLEGAAEHMRAVVEIARRSLAEGHDLTGRFLLDLGQLERDLGHREAAEAALLEAHDRLDEALGEGHPYTVEAREALAVLYEGAGESDRAEEWRSGMGGGRGAESPAPAAKGTDGG